MGAAAGARGRMGEATFASVVIHVLVALAIPALAWTASTVTPVETISFKHIVRIEVVPPRVPHPPPRAIAPHHDRRPIVNFASRVHLVSERPHLHATSEPAVATNAPVAPAIGTVARAGEATPRATRCPTQRLLRSFVPPLASANIRPGDICLLGRSNPIRYSIQAYANSSSRWART